jgi:hypothetical protein
MKLLLPLLALVLPMLAQSRRHEQLHAVASLEEETAENYKAICKTLEDLAYRKTTRFQMGCREMISDLKDQAIRSDEFASSQTDPDLILTRIKAEGDNLTDAATKASTYCGAATQISKRLNQKDTPLDCEKFKDAAAKVNEVIRRYVEEP